MPESRARIILAAVLAIAGCREEPPTVGAATSAEATATPPAAGAPAAAKPPAPVDRAAEVAAIVGRTVRDGLGDAKQIRDTPLYELTLDFDYDLFTYRGTETLRYVNAEKVPLDALNFLLYPNTSELTEAGTHNLAVREVRVNGAPATVKSDGPRLRVALSKPLPPGGEAVVSMTFDGVVFRLPAGSADLQKAALEQLLSLVLKDDERKGGYGVFSVGDDIVSLALWHPILVAHDEEGWDLDAGGKVGDVSHFGVAAFRVTVTAPDDVVVVASGVETRRHADGGRRTTTFEAGAVREIAVQMSREYGVASATVDGIRVNSYFKRGDREIGERVRDHAAAALRTFAALYGPYPYPELDVVASPLVGGAGGVEFPGLVTIARMFYGGGPMAGVGALPPGMTDHPFMRDTLEFVVAHEVAHQWWNAVVGSDSKKHPFLDEALANHSAVVYFEKVHSPEAARRQSDLQLTLNYQLARLAGARDRPVDLPTSAFDNMFEYAATVYGKGGLFFAALREQVGADRFDRRLGEYYRRFAFREARPDDLIDELTAVAPDPVAARALSNRWLRGTHGDEDIGPLELTEILRLLVGSVGEEQLAQLGLDPRAIRLLNGRGLTEVSKMVRQLVDPDHAPRDAVDYEAVLKLALELLDGDSEKAGRYARIAARLLDSSGGEPSSKDAARALLDVGRELAGDDKDTRLLLDVGAALLQYADEP